MLEQELKIGGLVLKNRVVMAPLTRCRTADDRVPNDLMAEYYRQRSGAGLIISEATVVTPDGVGYPNTPGIYNATQVAAWRRVVKGVHDAGGRMFLQLWHCGRSSHSSLLGGNLPVSASAIAITGQEIHTAAGKVSYEVPRPLETAEVPEIVALYARGARMAKDAGFDGVEIHAANGYLIDQFLQSATNHRTDAYGGSVENRYRFLREIVDAVLQVWSADRVGVRLSPNGTFNAMGSDDFRETFLYAAKQLDRHSLAYVHMIDGIDRGFHGKGEPLTLADLREVYRGRLMGNSGYTKESADAAIAAGNADLVAFGRPYITNPDLAERLLNGWPLRESNDASRWYAPGPEGYVDYAPYSAA